MRVVTLVTQKGGTGKSTLSTCLAVAAQQAGERVIALDLDPQGTLTAWAKMRDAEEPSVGALPPGQTAQLQGLLKGAKSKGYTVAIIDTAGRDSPEARAAMTQSTLCLVPLRPTRPDGLAIQPTVQALIGGKQAFAFVLSQCPPTSRGSRAAEMAAGLTSLGLLAEPMIHLRADYQDAFASGQGVTEYAPESKAAEEIRDLWAWIDRNAKGAP